MPFHLETVLAQRRACRATQQELFAFLASTEPSIVQTLQPLKSAQVGADRLGQYRLICTMEAQWKVDRCFTVYVNAERIRGKSFYVKVTPRDATSGTFFVIHGDASDIPALGYRRGIAAALQAVGI
jgi:hypothetical protein